MSLPKHLTPEAARAFAQHRMDVQRHINDMRDAFAAGCTTAMLLENAHDMDVVAESVYTEELTRIYGHKSPMYKACLKAWRTGAILTTEMLR